MEGSRVVGSRVEGSRVHHHGLLVSVGRVLQPYSRERVYIVCIVCSFVCNMGVMLVSISILSTLLTVAMSLVLLLMTYELILDHLVSRWGLVHRFRVATHGLVMLHTFYSLLLQALSL